MSSAMVASSPGPFFNERAQLREHAGLLIVFGIFSIILGLFALSATVFATMASVLVFGIILLIAGVIELVNAVLVRNWRGFALHLVAAVMYGLVGLFVLEDPVRAATVFTLVLAASFFVGGVLRVVLAIVQQFPAWPWVVLSGAVDILLGILIFNRWPGSSLWVIGLFLGIDLLIHGWHSVVLGIMVRSQPRAA